MKCFKYFLKVCLFLSISCFIILVSLYTYAYLSSGIDIKTSNSFYIYDNNDQLVYQGSGNSEWVDLEDVSTYFIDAIISTEDKHFYTHMGFDYFRIIKISELL